MHSEKNEIEGVRVLQIANRKQRIIEKCNIFQIVYTCRVCYLLAMYLWSYTVWFSLPRMFPPNEWCECVGIYIPEDACTISVEIRNTWKETKIFAAGVELLLYGQKRFMHKTSTQGKGRERERENFVRGSVFKSGLQSVSSKKNRQPVEFL